jgi:hypothetical protein
MEKELESMIRKYCVDNKTTIMGRDINKENVDDVIDFLIYREEQTHGLKKCRETVGFLREWFG